MRVLSCKYYFPSICFSKSPPCHSSPCPLKLEDGQHKFSRPSPVSHTSEEKSSGEKIEVENNESGNVKVEIFRKSSLKKSPPGSGSKEVEKGRVKWMDFVGKDLVEIREFEPIESEESEDDGGDNQSCICVIQ